MLIIDNVMSHVIDISSGSLYYGLKKLQERGLVEESSVEKIGKRPERLIYTITTEGQEYLDAETADFQAVLQCLGTGAIDYVR